jgi:DnaJ-class molecular chaperone
MAKPPDATDYYTVLGIHRTASLKAIKQAYRQRARQLHPDLNPSDEVAEERFKLLNEAYEVLSDQHKRQQYDRYGDRWQSSQGSRTSRPSVYQQNHDDFDEMEFGRHGSLEDILGDILNRYG